MGDRVYSGRRWRQLRADVLERDGWRCALCGRPIDPHARPGSEQAGTADHVVPVSRGGAWWDPRNLRAAHVGCNRARGNGRTTSGPVRYPPPRSW